MANEKIDPVVPPVITPPTPPVPPVDDGPAEPPMGDTLPKIEVKDKDDDGNELSDEEKANRYNRAAVNTALDNSVKIRVDNTVNNYLSQHPEYAPYADKIRTFVNHPNRFGLVKAGLPVENVIIEAIGVKNIMRIGAEMAAKSLADANQSKNDGGNKPTPPAGVTTDLRKMPMTDFAKLRDTINQGFVKR